MLSIIVEELFSKMSYWNNKKKLSKNNKNNKFYTK